MLWRGNTLRRDNSAWLLYYNQLNKHLLPNTLIFDEFNCFLDGKGAMESHFVRFLWTRKHVLRTSNSLRAAGWELYRSTGLRSLQHKQPLLHTRPQKRNKVNKVSKSLGEAQHS